MGTPTYDAHGNTKTMGAQTLTYDGSDRHVTTTTAATSVTFVRDATGRIISLVGGASVTKRGTGDVWSYPNIHGDVVATADPGGQAGPHPGL